MSEAKKDGSLWIASGLASLGFLIFVLIVFMGYRFFEILSVFSEILPEETRYKEQASWLIAFCLTTTTMVFMAHADYFQNPKAVKVYLFFVSLVINLMFWHVYDWKNTVFIVKGIFISTTIASVDYGLPHAFNVLRKQSGKLLDLKKLEETYNKLKEDYQKTLRDLKEARTEQQKIKTELKKSYCGECETQFISIQAKNRHNCKGSPTH